MRFKLHMSLALLAFTILAGTTLAQENYAQWSNYRNVILNTKASGANVAANQVNFPVLVRLTANDTAVFNHALAGGADIRFAKSSGKHLPYQIEQWNPTLKSAALWVLADTVKGNDSSVCFQMYWGQTGVADSSNGKAVFDTAKGYQGVWHMNGTVGVGDSDATVNKFFATAVNAPADTIGMIGRCKWFNHTNMYDTIKGTASGKLNFLTGTNYTLSAWICPDSFPSPGWRDSCYYTIISKGNKQYALAFGGLDSSNGIRYGLPEMMEYRSTWANTHPIVVSVAKQWLYVVGRVATSSAMDFDTVTTYVNGVRTVDTIASGTAAQTVTGDICIGRQSSVTGSTTTVPYREFWGMIDEVQMSNVARNADWIKLSYQTQKSGSSVVALGAILLNVPAPVAPTLATPANAATSVAVLPTFTWGTVAGATTYRVQIAAVSNFSTVAVDDSTLTAGTKTLTLPLSGNATYYWRASASNTSGSSPWSTVFSFSTVLAAPATPVLTTPANAATGIAIAPTLTWGTVAGAVTYRIQLSTISTFATTVVDDSTLTVGTKAITGLANSTVYFWRANAKNAGGTSAWAAAYSFTTVIAAPATAPTLSTPANAATGISITPTLTWSTVAGAATYHIQLSTVSTFATTVVDDSTLTVGTKTISPALTVNVTYYWRVNANNAGGTGAWSTLFSFKTVSTGIIAASPHYVPVTMGHNGVLEVYMANGSRVMEIAYGASATKTQLLNTASKTLAKGYYTYRFRGTDAKVEIIGKLVK